MIEGKNNGRNNGRKEKKQERKEGREERRKERRREKTKEGRKKVWNMIVLKQQIHHLKYAYRHSQLHRCTYDQS